MTYDVNTHHFEQIPSLSSSENSTPQETECGIHAIEINPSRTLIATGAQNANDVAVYRLPTLDPICVGDVRRRYLRIKRNSFYDPFHFQGAHKDWIFDMAWLDDQFVVSGSRDGSLALWRITDDMISDVTRSEHPTYQFMKPLWRKPCKAADRVRALTYNFRKEEIAVISLNGYIHCWNAGRFKQARTEEAPFLKTDRDVYLLLLLMLFQVMSKKLPHNMENVCLSTDEDAHMYAVGSKANIDLLDARTLQAIKKIPSR